MTKSRTEATIEQYGNLLVGQKALYGYASCYCTSIAVYESFSYLKWGTIIWTSLLLWWKFSQCLLHRCYFLFCDATIGAWYPRGYQLKTQFDESSIFTCWPADMAWYELLYLPNSRMPKPRNWVVMSVKKTLSHRHGPISLPQSLSHSSIAGLLNNSRSLHQIMTWVSASASITRWHFAGLISFGWNGWNIAVKGTLKCSPTAGSAAILTPMAFFYSATLHTWATGKTAWHD